MADRTIGSLPAAEQIDDDSLLVMEQQQTAMSVSGKLVKHYARQATAQYVEAAQDAAAAASGSADSAENSAESARQYAGKPPRIQDGTWWIWDAERQAYQDTGKPARGETGAQGEQGIQGDPGPQGLQGEPGKDGTSFVVKGIYPSLEALQAAHPTGVSGDAYAVGTEEKNVVYLWSEDGQEWQNVGSLQGPEGKQGQPGPQGLRGEKGDAGAPGPEGKQGETGPQGPAGQGVPAGGAAGKVLAKNSAQDYDAGWKELPSIYDTVAGNAGAHNSLFRGKFLGNAVTAAQYAAIKAGTFDDLFIGDYWVINGVTYRIAAFDYYLHCGDTDLTTHHAVIVPDTTLYSAQMNNTVTTTGAYVGSAMYKANLENAKTIIKATFSGHVLKHRLYLNNTISSYGLPSNGLWCDSEVDLMCEHMVYGSGIFSPVADGNTIPQTIRVEKGQLPLFALAPEFIVVRGFNYWLRDVLTSDSFAYVHYDGCVSFSIATPSRGIRPAFCICG